MNITHGRIGRISIRILLGYIGKRADGLERCKLGVLVVETALVYEFLILTFGFAIGFGFVLEYWDFHIFFLFGLVPKFSYLWR